MTYQKFDDYMVFSTKGEGTIKVHFMADWEGEARIRYTHPDGETCDEMVIPGRLAEFVFDRPRKGRGDAAKIIGSVKMALLGIDPGDAGGEIARDVYELHQQAKEEASQ